MNGDAIIILLQTLGSFLTFLSLKTREPLGGKAAQTNEKQTVGLRQSKLEKQRLSRNVQLLNLQVLEGQLS